MLILNSPPPPSNTHSRVLITPSKLDEILEAIPLVDFKEDFEVGRQECEVEVGDVVLFYTVSASIFRTEHGGGFTSEVSWCTLKSYIYVDDLMIYDLEGEEIEASNEVIEAITEQIKQNVEY